MSTSLHEAKASLRPQTKILLNDETEAIRAPPRISGEIKNSRGSAVILIERRSFIRDCIQSTLSDATDLLGIGLSGVDEYLANAAKLKAAVIVVCALGASAQEVATHLTQLKDAGCSVPIVVMSDRDDVEVIMMVIEKGAKGFMPFDISLPIATHALRLVAAGGQYFPAVSLLAARRAIDKTQCVSVGPTNVFTRRQAAVIDALRKGKANKIIAYELNMRESTVKVHVRNIMKKLNAKNRTEVAYLSNEMLEGHP